MIINNVSGGGKNYKLGVVKRGANLNTDIRAHNIAPSAVVTMPSKTVDGTDLNISFAPSYDFWFSLIYAVKKLIIPESFTSFSFWGGTTDYGTYDGSLEDLEIHSNAVQLPDNDNSNIFSHIVSFKKLTITKNPGSDIPVYMQRRKLDKSYYGNEITVEVNLPEFTGKVVPDLGLMDNKTTQRKTFVKYNCPKATKFGPINASSTRVGYFGFVRPGDGVFPSVTDIAGLCIPFTESAEYRFPKLETFVDTNTQMFEKDNSADGVLDLYIGPNVSHINSTVATRAATRIGEGLLVIHIPSGSSTTKTTLDNASVTTYVQDYDTTYPEDLA